MKSSENCEYCANYDNCENNHKWSYEDFKLAKTDIEKVNFFLCKECRSNKSVPQTQFLGLKNRVNKELEDTGRYVPKILRKN